MEQLKIQKGGVEKLGDYTLRVGKNGTNVLIDKKEGLPGFKKDKPVFTGAIGADGILKSQTSSLTSRELSNLEALSDRVWSRNDEALSEFEVGEAEWVNSSNSNSKQRWNDSQWNDVVTDLGEIKRDFSPRDLEPYLLNIIDNNKDQLSEGMVGSVTLPTKDGKTAFTVERLPDQTYEITELNNPREAVKFKVFEKEKKPKTFGRTRSSSKPKKERKIHFTDQHLGKEAKYWLAEMGGYEPNRQNPREILKQRTQQIIRDLNGMKHGQIVRFGDYALLKLDDKIEGKTFSQRNIHAYELRKKAEDGKVLLVNAYVVDSSGKFAEAQSIIDAVKEGTHGQASIDAAEVENFTADYARGKRQIENQLRAGQIEYGYEHSKKNKENNKGTIELS